MGIFLIVVTIVVVALAARFLPLNKAGTIITFSSPSSGPTASPSTSPAPTVLPTVKPKARNNISINIVNPTPTSAPVRGNISDYIYPNSQVNSQTDSSLELTSTDSPDAIANWYKDKIKSKNMNINTFVTTNVNDQIQDKLVGDSATASVSVEIDKNSGSSEVMMKVNI